MRDVENFWQISYISNSDLGTAAAELSRPTCLLVFSWVWNFVQWQTTTRWPLWAISTWSSWRLCRVSWWWTIVWSRTCWSTTWGLCIGSSQGPAGVILPWSICFRPICEDVLLWRTCGACPGVLWQAAAGSVSSARLFSHFVRATVRSIVRNVEIVAALIVIMVAFTVCHQFLVLPVR